MERFDKFDHWPDVDNKVSRSRCKMPGCKSHTNVFCIKCGVFLCFTRNRHCFRYYHVNVATTKGSKPSIEKRKHQTHLLQKAMKQAEEDNCATKSSIRTRPVEKLGAGRAVDLDTAKSFATESNRKIQKSSSLLKATPRNGDKDQQLKFFENLGLIKRVRKSNRRSSKGIDYAKLAKVGQIKVRIGLSAC